MFHKLSSDEKAVVNKVLRRKGVKTIPVSSAYVTDGNFTVALVKSKDGLRVGVSKRNPTDNPNEQVGKTIALIRAVTGDAVVR